MSSTSRSTQSPSSIMILAASKGSCSRDFSELFDSDPPSPEPDDESTSRSGCGLRINENEILPCESTLI
ncbi:hypothetical protein Hanom_Chr12g01097411 [Helianthus anomalus]